MTLALKIPDDLAAQASRIPGLNERIERFIQLEIVQYEQRMKRFRPETMDMVERARKNAQSQRATGYNLDEVKLSFEKHFDERTGSRTL